MACNGFFITMVNSCFSDKSTLSPSMALHSNAHTKFAKKSSPLCTSSTSLICRSSRRSPKHIKTRRQNIAYWKWSTARTAVLGPAALSRSSRMAVDVVSVPPLRNSEQRLTISASVSFRFPSSGGSSRFSKVST
ncbi:hypothetical protein CRG98_041869 [Punica granatum]|uniref:Uncharacterized protein n=1 Tax=Punica granatum TaxID=22663 RepID=A0A2I0I1D6_PUNGR|nr:hypothetical protein CRG98_041869 [Punica granatum]